MSKDFRTEKDTMGEMQVPADSLYGASTQRAVINFPISDLRFDRELIYAIACIKQSAAKSNLELGDLAEDKAAAIIEAAGEVMSGSLDSHFVVDIFQTGSGTSSNMNANEVIANRAVQILGGSVGDKSVVHPNDHVNMSQSSNDVIPSTIHIAACRAINEKLAPALDVLAKALDSKANEFKSVIKSGRTHLQDATPVTLGQEFGGYASQIADCQKRIQSSLEFLSELALGGTAVGTGLNADPKFAPRAIELISEATGIKFKEARNHFAAQGARDAAMEMSGQLKTLAVAMMKIADDLRWLASGPRCGLGEINLPEIQPGSSIMPAKVNPVICESVMMAAAQVIGNDSCITVGAQRGNFELNVMLPVIGYNLLQSINLLSNSANNFVEKCISGITANAEVCHEYAEQSLATCTSLAPIIGYDKAAAVAKLAHKEGISVREAAIQLEVLPEDELSKALDLMAMT